MAEKGEIITRNGWTRGKWLSKMAEKGENNY